MSNGTILFAGVSSRIGDDEVRYYAATMPTAAGYAFGTERGNPNSKIIAMETSKDILLLDMTSRANYDALRKISVPMVVEDLDILRYAFDDGRRRDSRPDTDRIFADWICSTLPQFHGWCVTDIRGGHDEVFICRPELVLQRLPLEIRVDRKRQRFLVTQHGQKISSLKPTELHTAITPAVWGKPHYKRDINKQSDAFLFSSERNKSQKSV